MNIRFGSCALGIAAAVAIALPRPSLAADEKDNKDKPAAPKPEERPPEKNGEKKEDDRPAERIPGVKYRVFELKHRTPDDVMGVLRPLSSGVRGTTIAGNDAFKMITVRDFPENIAAMDDALRRLDVAGVTRPDIELRMRVLIAGPTGPGHVPQDLDGVVKQLHATLNYRSYFQVASITQRVRASSGTGGKGVAQVNPPVTTESAAINYTFAFDNVNVLPPANGGPTLVSIRRLRFQMGNKALGEADITTALSLRENEKVVVGTGSLKERAVIVVLSTKILK